VDGTIGRCAQFEVITGADVEHRHRKTVGGLVVQQRELDAVGVALGELPSVAPAWLEFAHRDLPLVAVMLAADNVCAAAWRSHRRNRRCAYAVTRVRMPRGKR
jgi:hypothetical protein